MGSKRGLGCTKYEDGLRVFCSLNGVFCSLGKGKRLGKGQHHLGKEKHQTLWRGCRDKKNFPKSITSLICTPRLPWPHYRWPSSGLSTRHRPKTVGDAYTQNKQFGTWKWMMLSWRNFLFKPEILVCFKFDLAFWQVQMVWERISWKTGQLSTSQLSITTWKKMEKNMKRCGRCLISLGPKRTWNKSWKFKLSLWWAI